MKWYDEAALYVLIFFDMVGPGVFLLLLRRWMRRWWIAILGVICVFPIIAFCLTGGIAWLMTYLQVFVRGDTSVANKMGVTAMQYVNYSGFGTGVYGVMFAGMGLAISLPFILAWRLIQKASFQRFTQTDAPRSLEK
jgi:hypothetical protein